MEQINDTIYTLRAPSNIIISGATGSGKTYLLLKLLKDWPFDLAKGKIIYFYNVWQPLFEDFLKLFPSLQFCQGLCQDIIEHEFTPQDGTVNICICDDLADVAVKSDTFSRMFTVYGHHKSIVSIFITQNPFFRGPFSTTINRNTHYFILTKTPHLNVLNTLNTQLYGTKGPVKDAYLHAMKEKPYNYLLIDVFCEDIKNRLRSNILKTEFPMIVWRPEGNL